MTVVVVFWCATFTGRTCGAVLIVDDINVEPVLAMLHHFRGNNQDVLLDPELQSRRHGEPRPERVVLVLELAP